MNKEAQEAIDRSIKQIKDNIILLRQLVYMEDIPSSNCPEYQEHHQSIQRILHAIDDLLKEVTCE